MSTFTRIILLIGVVLAQSACDELSTPTQPAPAAPTASIASSAGATVYQGSGSVPYGGLVFSCSGEPILMNGTITYRWHTTARATGDWMTTQHVRFSASGEGLWSGANYRGIGEGNTTQVYAMPSGGAFTYTTSFRLLDIVQGSADDSVFTLRARWTINANGEVVQEGFEVEAGCRG